MTRPALCQVCADRPTAMPRVPYCFTCWPGGPVQAPPCLRCGSRTHYYAVGLCRRCHPAATPPPDSCRNCLAWGATRHLKWLCHGCLTWTYTYAGPAAPCRVCAWESILDGDRVCRSCRKQAALVRSVRGPLVTLEESITNGHQLFIADLFCRRRPSAPATAAPPPTATALPALPAPGPRAGTTGPTTAADVVPGLPAASTHCQPVLFEMARTINHQAPLSLAQSADPAALARAQQAVALRAARLGWHKRQTADVRIGVAVLLGLQGDAGGQVRVEDAPVLLQFDHLPLKHTLDVLDDAGLLADQRTRDTAAWARPRLAVLPAPMAEELHTWLDILLHGSTSTPRRRPRSPITARLYLDWVLPVVTHWSCAGKTSLREITHQDTLQALPTAAAAKAHTGRALRSLFGILHARSLIPTDPTSGIKTGYIRTKVPVPLDPAPIREALNDPDPARALATALIAFHALTSHQVLTLCLADLHPGRLQLGPRSIPLATPVAERLAAYLDHRTRRWPATANPHLFLNTRNANGTRPVGRRWLKLLLAPHLTATALRTDRLLDQAQATNGDTRNLETLFGLSNATAQRYTHTVTNNRQDNGAPPPRAPAVPVDHPPRCSSPSRAAAAPAHTPATLGTPPGPSPVGHRHPRPTTQPAMLPGATPPERSPTQAERSRGPARATKARTAYQTSPETPTSSHLKAAPGRFNRDDVNYSDSSTLPAANNPAPRIPFQDGVPTPETSVIKNEIRLRPGRGRPSARRRDKPQPGSHGRPRFHRNRLIRLVPIQEIPRPLLLRCRVSRIDIKHRDRHLGAVTEVLGVHGELLAVVEPLAGASAVEGPDLGRELQPQPALAVAGRLVAEQRSSQGIINGATAGGNHQVSPTSDRADSETLPHPHTKPRPHRAQQRAGRPGNASWPGPGAVRASRPGRLG